MESKYLSQFEKLLNPEAKQLYKLMGGRILVELLPAQEIKTSGGLILSAPSNQVKLSAQSQQAVLAIVLMTGEGYVDGEGNDVPMDVKVGNVVMLNDLGLRAYSTFPGVIGYTQSTIALSNEGDVQMLFNSILDYQKYTEVLNK